MDKYEVSKKDIISNYFHFTSKDNLDSIQEKGLIPMKGKHAKYIEKSKKVFFVEGLDNLLILFDCWINIFYYKPKIPFIYTLGALFLRQKWFPQIISDMYFWFLKKTKIHQKRAYKIFDQLLEDSVLLNLYLEENIDFRYDDIDEIKSRNYKKRHLEIMGYKKEYSSLEKNSMDYWNLHCLSNHRIDSKKIKLCYLNGSCNIREIFEYAVDNTTIDLETICPILYGYLRYKEIR